MQKVFLHLLDIIVDKNHSLQSGDLNIELILSKQIVVKHSIIVSSCITKKVFINQYNRSRIVLERLGILRSRKPKMRIQNSNELQPQPTASNVYMYMICLT